MNDRTLVRGLFLMAIALAFGLQSLRYSIGSFAHAGAGLFPLMISVLLGVVALITIVRSRFVARQRLEPHVKNIAIIIGSLCGFALISRWNMIAGIVFMVFFAGFAASTYSIARNVKICVGLVAIALLFQKGLGLNLPLY